MRPVPLNDPERRFHPGRTQSGRRAIALSGKRAARGMRCAAETDLRLSDDALAGSDAALRADRRGRAGARIACGALRDGFLRPLGSLDCTEATRDAEAEFEDPS